MSKVYLLPTFTQEKNVPEEIVSDTLSPNRDLSYLLHAYATPATRRICNLEPLTQGKRI